MPFADSNLDIMDGYKTAPADVSLESAQGKGDWIRVAMGVGTLRLGNLKLCQWRHLTTQEEEELKQPVKRIGTK